LSVPRRTTKKQKTKFSTGKAMCEKGTEAIIYPRFMQYRAEMILVPFPETEVT
jgi:hypothetical protein